MSRTGAVRCLAAAVLFGASAPAASVLALDMPAPVLAGLLYLGAAVAVAPAVARNRPTAAGLRADGRRMTVAVVAGGAIGPVLLVAGLARIEAASASILLNLELLATVALAATLFREHLGRRVIAGAGLVGMAGALLVGEPGAQLSMGALFIAGACACWGLDNCVTARIDHLAPEHVVAAKGFVAGSLSLALGLALGSDVTAIAPGQVVAALAIGAAGYGLSITLWVKGARNLGAARAQVIFATAPFVGAVVAWTVLGEPVTAVQLFAMALAGLGIAMSLDSGHTHRHRHPRVSHDHEHAHDDRHHAHTHHDGYRGRHAHQHEHGELVHTHPHLPDLHHRHSHHDT